MNITTICSRLPGLLPEEIGWRGCLSDRRPETYVFW